MKRRLFAVLVALLVFGIHAGAEEKPNPDEIIFPRCDFNNNTFGEIVIKLNAMFREQAHGRANWTVLVNLKGMTEPQIARVLNRKTVNWPSLENVPALEMVLYVVQVYNCVVKFQDHDIILTPTPPYLDKPIDIAAMFGLHHTHEYN